MQGYAARVQRLLVIRLAIFLACVIAIAVFVSVNCDYLKGIFQNVLSDFITLAILAGFGLIVIFTTERSVRLDFFNVRQSKSMVVYLSRLFIVNEGSVGRDYVQNRDVLGSFQGIAFPKYEADFMPRFQSLFNFIIPGTENVAGFLQKLFVADVSVTFCPAPAAEEHVENTGTFVSLGSPLYNAASRRVEEHFKPPATFSQAGGLLLYGEEIEDKTNTYAFVQRVRNPQTGQTAFYLAGSSWQATTAAINYFFEHWRQLAKDYPKGEPFCIIVRALVGANAQYIGVEKVDRDTQKKRSAATWGGLLTFSLLLLGFATMRRRPRR